MFCPRVPRVFHIIHSLWVSFSSIMTDKSVNTKTGRLFFYFNT